ncbi:mismatch-specific DNA-glycosylase [Rhodovulum sp. DZ06]|uniref:mismatch-specific DNA-glycosylase n=1 Tax=Rhodovulum sp. DZ06 TaxID=3425126 RepID=UPI003D32CEDC
MLPDLLLPELDLVICSTAAGPRSAARGRYYAGRGNRFWRVLAETGLTPTELSPDRDHALLAHGIGLTDLAKGVSGMDRDLPQGALGADAAAALRGRIEAFRPRRVAFNGLGAARAALGKRAVPGPGRLAPELIPGVELWALPSTSGAARGHWDIGPWQALAAAMGRG